MPRPTRLTAAVLVAAGVLLAGCSLPFGGSGGADGPGRNAAAGATAGPAGSPTTPADFVAPPSPPAPVTGTDQPADPTGTPVLASGPFCRTAKASISAWGGNPLAKLQEFARSPGSTDQLKAYLAQAASDATSLLASAPPQVRSEVSTIADAVTRLNLGLRANGYDLSRVGALASAVKVLTEPAVAAAWLRLTDFVQSRCGVGL